jgi:hypothetical protein
MEVQYDGQPPRLRPHRTIPEYITFDTYEE